MKYPRARRLDARYLRAAVALLLASGAALSLAAGCGADSLIVGGDCAAGYEACGTKCVDLAVDPNNCGGCGRACAPGVACSGGVCGGSVDATTDAPADGRTDAPADATADGTTDAEGDGALDGSSSEAGDGSIVSDAGDASPDDGSVSDSEPPADACAPPYVTPLHCGDCSTVCGGTTPLCEPAGDAGAYVCAPLCPTGLQYCDGTCVDTSSNPRHCGRCHNLCASTLCVASLCTGSAPRGHIVVIGHAYESTAPFTSQARLLANAVFLSAHNPVRVLAYDEYASSAAVAGVRAILAQHAASVGRTVTFTTASDGIDLPTRIDAALVDVILVLDQRTAAPGVLGPLATGLAAPLQTFVTSGGVVVMLDGMTGTTDQMNVFATNAGLLAVPTHRSIPFQRPLDVRLPLSAVGSGVVTPYGASADSASFTTPETLGTDAAMVVADPTDDEAVAVHKLVF